MPAFLEKKLKAEYPNNPHAVYGTLNAIGAMRGNKETAKGRAMDRKHARDERAGTAEGETKMARLTAAKRRALPDSAFAIPSKREYPEDTPARARAAAGLAGMHHESAAVKSAIHKKAVEKGYSSGGHVGRLTSPHAHGHVTEGLHGGHVTPKNSAHLRGKHGY